MYRELRGAYRDEYVMYNLAAAALAQVGGRMWAAWGVECARCMHLHLAGALGRCDFKPKSMCWPRHALLIFHCSTCLMGACQLQDGAVAPLGRVFLGGARGAGMLTPNHPQQAAAPTHPHPHTTSLQALPRLGQLLVGWSPLGQPSLPVAEFASWRPLLESEGAQQGGVFGADLSADPYARLVAELVLPPLRKELINDWDPRCVCGGVGTCQ